MSKDKISDYDPVAAQNTDVGGVNLSEGVMVPSDLNNALRELMAASVSAAIALSSCRTQWQSDANHDRHGARAFLRVSHPVRVRPDCWRTARSCYPAGRGDSRHRS